MPVVFWMLCGLVFYVYVGYPLLLHASARLARKKTINTHRQFEPSVSIVIAARNEASRVPGRLDNLRQLDYPDGKQQVIVVSDGSTDETPRLLARTPGVVAVDVQTSGKACALNAGVARATGDIVVFADMRQAFAPDALRALVAPFRDPRVGAVTGELVLNGESRDRRQDDDRRAEQDRRAVEDRRDDMRRTAGQRKSRRRWSGRRARFESTITDGVGLYWRYEKQIRRDESATGSVVGATGAIYALRRSLWQPLPPDTILDDVLAPMRCVMAGYRVVFQERACAFDRTAPDASTEGRRKLRTLAGNYQLLWLEPRLLLPWRNPAWLQFVSHKVGRLLVPYTLPLLLLSSLLLARRAPVYAAAFTVQFVFYLLAAYGAWLEHARQATPESLALTVNPLNRLARVALMFLVMNTSAVAGLVALATKQKVWR
jgi:cellulose synthase/poly-beta-1,6-N-acetylglucosamine synthase-like glycosyltransferase